MPETTGEVEIEVECKCPKCGHKWSETQTHEVTLEFDIDWSDYAPDHSWRD